MKKLVIAALFAVGFSSAVTGQEKGNIEIGVNAGFNYSIASNGYLQTETGYGFNGGASAEYYFSDSWGIKAKVIFDQKGWNEDYYPLVVPRLTNFNLNYITVPVMANWHFAEKRNWYLNFGPYIGFLGSAKETTGSEDIKYLFNTTDFGIAYGIGVKIPVSGKMKVSFEFEGQEGLTDIFKDNPNSSVTNSRGSLNVGLFFLLK